MAHAPIVVKCECGIETRGKSGSVIRCDGCGLRFDTTDEARVLDTIASMTQKRFKYLSRAGIGFLGLLALGGLALFHVPGLVGGAALGAALWYVALMPFAKRRMLRKAVALYTPTVTASRK